MTEGEVWFKMAALTALLVFFGWVMVAFW